MGGVGGGEGEDESAMKCITSQSTSRFHHKSLATFSAAMHVAPGHTASSNHVADNCGGITGGGTLGEGACHVSLGANQPNCRKDYKKRSGYFLEPGPLSGGYQEGISSCLLPCLAASLRGAKTDVTLNSTHCLLKISVRCGSADSINPRRAFHQA